MNETGISMRRPSEAAEAMSPCTARGGTRTRPREFYRLAVPAKVIGKSGKFPTQPLRDQTGSDRLTEPPGCDQPHRERVGDRQAEQLCERPGARANLYPQFGHGARLLPDVVESPPALEIVEQRFYPPAAGVELRDYFGIQIRFGG